MNSTLTCVCSQLVRTCRLFVAIIIICQTTVINAACKKEKGHAQQAANRIAMEWPLRPALDSKTQYIQKLADNLIRVIEVEFSSKKFDWPSQVWRLLLVRDSSVNAYSIGDGKVYINDGTFNFVETEAELAAILAHEIAHQLIGHFCQHSETQVTHSIGSFLQVMDNKKEMAADALAVEILQKAYYPAQAMLEVVERIPASIEDNGQKQLRIKALEQQTQGLKRIPFASSKKFVQIKKNQAKVN
jgi:predicted Zn-dependent protease